MRIENIDEIVANDCEDPAEFTQLLEMGAVNPFTSWEVVRDKLAMDPRYLAVNTDRRRRELFKEWTETQKSNSVEPKSQFLVAVRSKYAGTPYPIFKRKIRADPEFTGIALPESERASLYREYATYIKLDDAEKQQFVRDHPYFDCVS